MAAPTFVDWMIDGGGSSSTVVLNWDSIVGEADNDVAFAFLYGEAQADPTGVPSGWTLYHSWDQTTGGFKYRGHVYWRRRAGDTSTATWTFAGTVWRSGLMAVYRGLITSGTPLLPATPDEDIEAAQDTEPSHPGITVATANAGLLFATINFAGSTITTDPTGFTNRDADNEEWHVWDDLTVTAGATGAVAADLVNPEYVSSILIELLTESPAVLSREQEGYRWRADDGDEDAATWLDAQDTDISRAKDTVTRLRVLTNVTLDAPSEALKLQYRKVGDATWLDLGTG